MGGSVCTAHSGRRVGTRDLAEPRRKTESVIMSAKFTPLQAGEQLLQTIPANLWDVFCISFQIKFTYGRKTRTKTPPASANRQPCKPSPELPPLCLGSHMSRKVLQVGCS